MAVSKDDGPKVVPVHQGHEHGYIGRVTDETPNDEYTVAGRAGATANADDPPRSSRSTSKS